MAATNNSIEAANNAIIKMGNKMHTNIDITVFGRTMHFLIDTSRSMKSIRVEALDEWNRMQCNKDPEDRDREYPIDESTYKRFRFEATLCIIDGTETFEANWGRMCSNDLWLVPH